MESKTKPRLLLNLQNVDAETTAYLRELYTTLLPDLPTDPVQAFLILKRLPIRSGRYPHTSTFETANRVLSDLIVLSAAEHLLSSPLPGLVSIQLNELEVVLGTGAGHDIVSRPATGPTVVGECFNVAKSFFQTKLARTKQKLRDAGPAHRVVAFNRDAVDDPQRYERKSDPDWSYLPLDVDNWIRKRVPSRSP